MDSTYMEWPPSSIADWSCLSHRRRSGRWYFIICHFLLGSYGLRRCCDCAPFPPPRQPTDYSVSRPFSSSLSSAIVSPPYFSSVSPDDLPAWGGLSGATRGEEIVPFFHRRSESDVESRFSEPPLSDPNAVAGQFSPYQFFRTEASLFPNAPFPPSSLPSLEENNTASQRQRFYRKGWLHNWPVDRFYPADVQLLRSAPPTSQVQTIPGETNFKFLADQIDPVLHQQQTNHLGTTTSGQTIFPPTLKDNLSTSDKIFASHETVRQDRNNTSSAKVTLLVSSSSTPPPPPPIRNRDGVSTTTVHPPNSMEGTTSTRETMGAADMSGRAAPAFSESEQEVLQGLQYLPARPPSLDFPDLSVPEDDISLGLIDVSLTPLPSVSVQPKIKLPKVPPLIPPDGTGMSPEPSLPVAAYPFEVRCPRGWYPVGPHCGTIMSVPGYTECPGDVKQFHRGLRKQLVHDEGDLGGVCKMRETISPSLSCPPGFTLKLLSRIPNTPIGIPKRDPERISTLQEQQPMHQVKNVETLSSSQQPASLLERRRRLQRGRSRETEPGWGRVGGAIQDSDDGTEPNRTSSPDGDGWRGIWSSRNGERREVDGTELMRIGKDGRREAPGAKGHFSSHPSPGPLYQKTAGSAGHPRGFPLMVEQYYHTPNNPLAASGVSPARQKTTRRPGPARIDRMRRRSRNDGIGALGRRLGIRRRKKEFPDEPNVYACEGQDVIPFLMLDSMACPAGYLPSLDGCHAMQSFTPSVACPASFKVGGVPLSEYAFHGKELAECGLTTMYKGRLWCPKGFVPFGLPLPDMPFGTRIDSKLLKNPPATQEGQHRRLDEEGMRKGEAAKLEEKDKKVTEKKVEKDQGEEHKRIHLNLQCNGLEEDDFVELFEEDVYKRSTVSHCSAARATSSRNNFTDKSIMNTNNALSAKSSSTDDNRHSHSNNSRDSSNTAPTTGSELGGQPAVIIVTEAMIRSAAQSTNDELYSPNGLEASDLPITFLGSSDFPPSFVSSSPGSASSISDTSPSPPLSPPSFSSVPRRLQVPGQLPTEPGCVQVVTVFASNCDRYSCHSPYLKELDKELRHWIYYKLEGDPDQVNQVIATGRDMTNL